MGEKYGKKVKKGTTSPFYLYLKSLNFDFNNPNVELFLSIETMSFKEG